MPKNTTRKSAKTTINKVTKHTSAKAVSKSTSSKKIARLPSLVEFRSKIHAKGKPLSQMVIEGRR